MSLCNQTIPRHKFPVSTSNSDVFPDTAKRSLLSLTQQCSGIFAPLCLFSILLYQGRVSFVNNIYAFSFIWLCRFFLFKLYFMQCIFIMVFSLPTSPRFSFPSYEPNFKFSLLLHSLSKKIEIEIKTDKNKNTVQQKKWSPFLWWSTPPGSEAFPGMWLIFTLSLFLQKNRYSLSLKVFILNSLLGGWDFVPAFLPSAWILSGTLKTLWMLSQSL